MDVKGQNLSKHGDADCGILTLGIQNQIDFSNKVNCLKGFSDICYDEMMASRQKCTGLQTI